MSLQNGNPGSAHTPADFSNLMDLRVDYAFKLFFGSGDARYLVSLLNAVFANKGIGRRIEKLVVANPFLERHSQSDKLSVLDIRALLDDGSTALIEMHLYDLGGMKYKTIRSWARAYGEELAAGESYSAQPPVICVAFTNGPVESIGSEDARANVHACCKIMDIDSKAMFSDAMELHYVNMKEAVKMIAEKSEAIDPMLMKWLALITAKDIEDKSVIENICKEDETIAMAVTELARLSEDKIVRQAYQRRLDDIMVYNSRLSEYRKIAEHESRRASAAEAEIESLRRQLTELKLRSE